MGDQRGEARGSDPGERDAEAWRAIVANYGDRPVLPDDEVTAAREEPARLSSADDEALADGREWLEFDPLTDEPEPFLPPDPPLPPRPTGLRLAAWLGVIGAPAVLLVCLILDITLDGLLSLGLVGAFIGGFCYLIATLPDREDPFDDGAVV